MRPTFAIVIAAFFSLGAQALEAPIEGYGVEDFEWEVEASPGNKLRLRGTIEEVTNQVRSINPNYRYEKRDDTNASTGSLEKRYDEESLICYPNGWGAADGNTVQEGVEYLKNDVAGQPTNGPGPGNCGRVSCSYNNAIWWCNDNTESKTLDSFREIGLAAEEICNRCWMSAVASNSGFENLCAGQMFMKDKWNVIRCIEDISQPPIAEVKNIQDQVYLQVATKNGGHLSGDRRLIRNPHMITRRRERLLSGGHGYYNLDAPDNAGYQWCQTRGLIVIQTKDYGKVAVLPIGMAQVSSVVMTVKKGDHVKKGDNISYFQFGGSDVVVVFEKKVTFKSGLKPDETKLNVRSELARFQ